VAPSVTPSGEGSSTPTLTLPHDDRVAIELALSVHFGQLDVLRRLLTERPELASVGIVGPKGLEGGWRTPLHVATDWPGYFPSAPESASMLLEAGADPNLDSGGTFAETPLHWAASNDDLDVAVVLIDGGARLDTPGGSIGTPLDNAVGYGCWNVARLLADRGARVDRLWQAAALGMLPRLEELLAATPAPAESEVNHAFFQACHGGQFRAAQRLLAAGADTTAVPDYAGDSTALDVALHPGTRREQLATWLREQGVGDAGSDHDGGNHGDAEAG
jgi:ankyrin repeat protein